MLALQILAIVILTLASAFSSAAEVAFFSLSSSRIRSFRQHASARKRQVARILMQSKSLLVTIFMFNTLVNVLLQNVTSDLFDQLGGWVLKVGLPLFLVLIFGELAPKYFALLYNETMAVAFAPLVDILQWISTPLRLIITKISNFLSRILFFFLKADMPPSIEELQHILQSSEGKGLLHRDEAELILGVLSLEDKQIKEIMQPRSDMPLYNIKEPLSKLIYLFSEENLPEICVIEQEETVLGTISSKTFFMKKNEIESSKDLLIWLQRPLFIPETSTTKTALEQLREQKVSIALVIDEYGSSVGLVSERDIIDQIIKTKRAPEEEEFTRVSKDAIIATSTLPLSKIKELFGITLTSAYHVITLGGWLAEKLDKIPQSGEIWREKELFFRVLSADPTRIRKIYIQHEKRNTP